MAVQIPHTQQVNALETLAALIDLVKNPKQISVAQEEARKQIALTEGEARKAAEAKDFIAKYNELQKDIKAREDKLVADKNAHEQTVFAVTESFTARDTILKDGFLKLKQEQNIQADKAKALASDKGALEEVKVRHEQEYQEMLKKLNTITLSNDNARAANEAMFERLVDKEKKLEAKAAIYKQAEAV